MDERDGRIAFVSERFELDDAFRLSGRFNVHWEMLDGEDAEDGPEAVSVEEAIAWGRQHARFVSVRLGDSDTHYSAGENELADLDDRDDDRYRGWPAGGMIIRPRPMGAPRDGSVQEVDWLVEASAVDVPEHSEQELTRLRAAFADDGRLRGVELSASRGRVGVRCVVRARGGGAAVAEVDRAFGEALTVAFPERHGSSFSTGCVGPVGAIAVR